MLLAQIVRETIAGSWGVLPAKAAHVWRILEPAARDGKSMWAELMATGQVVFATDLIAAADAKAAAEAAAAMPAEEVAAKQAWRGAVRQRELKLLKEAAGEAAKPLQLTGAGGGGAAAAAASRKIAACALPLQVSHGGFESVLESEACALLAATGNDARFVLLGECTHGTQQFYDVRAALSRLLIERHGFQAVVVEGDWPDAQRVHRCKHALASNACIGGIEPRTSNAPRAHVHALLRAPNAAVCGL